MLFIIWAALIICGLLCPKSKIVSALMILFMFVVIGFRTQGADYIIYRNEFIWSKYQTFSDVHYVGYLVLEQIAHRLGVSFTSHIMIIGGISCLLMYYGVRRLTEWSNAAFALFLIYPFSHEAIQTRTFLANAVLIAALPLVLKDSQNEQDIKRHHRWHMPQIVMFYLLAFLACTFHYEAAIYVAFITMMLFLPERYGRSWVITATVVTFLLIETGILPSIVSRFNTRISYWLSGRTGLGMIIPIAISLVIWYSMQIVGKACLRTYSADESSQDFYKKVLRFSDYIILLIPLFCYDITFNRLWRLFLLLLYIMIADLYMHRISTNIRLWIVVTLVVLFAATCIYENVFTLLYGIMQNNGIFGGWSVL